MDLKGLLEAIKKIGGLINLIKRLFLSFASYKLTGCIYSLIILVNILKQLSIIITTGGFCKVYEKTRNDLLWNLNRI